ncbi:MAG: transcription antitermination factor NusB [Candidatus Pacebacteria bacterium]|jgi:N utilization substance protein B|nr:transcription antitermination factor NusB [Candidatus Paceibacterota bacterium]
MANRHLSRSIVLQTLFEWDFNNKKASSEEVAAILARNIKEFGPGLDDQAFMQGLIDLVVKKGKIIDDVIEKAAPDWPIDKISSVDRNILRLGLAELLFGNRTEVPPKVAINEAIELAKTFGGENSGKFVNGVLGAVYKELGEPGKEEVSKKKKTAEPVDISKLPVETLVGAVVYAYKNGEILLALVHDVFGRWTLSKGKLEEGEEEEAGVIRKVKQEIGLTVEVKDKLGGNEYVASHPEKGKTLKKVSFFLAEAKYGELTLDDSGGLDDAHWFKLADITELKMYDDMLPVITKGVALLAKGN